MSKQVIAILAALSVAITGCGTVQGDAPGRAIVPAVAPYDATHLDPGFINGSANTTSGGATSNAGGDQSTPQLVP
jgi:hypothetical protein